jgi:hypothetical protein
LLLDQYARQINWSSRRQRIGADFFADSQIRSDNGEAKSGGSDSFPESILGNEPKYSVSGGHGKNFMNDPG